ncbi:MULTISPECIES: hypothetical protein [Vibrio]|uniref:Uncharacterized protein n=4 Tax=Vibrio TaxID=662 RepID=A0A2N7NGJ3_9VIBR|nr:MULTISPECIES: hypothetical protein [Vibrio]MCC4790591.1 hypothetical protein [Vibrio splendidus]MCC4892321.1 hypothetical protein [Vibrio sp. F13]MCF7506372.1 hypothetical protein [Vibrio sp. L3-7]MCW4446205.1 hypothetical protein [Vibrio splendidus]OEE04432.1 hypothetical protein OC7_09230 [Vibrio cyclitrophicus ZF270]
MRNQRLSQIQKEILSCLAKGFVKGVKEGKSTVVNHAINQLLRREVPPNNFRVSCEIIEERGLIRRKKVNLDWYINITPEVFDKAL